MSANFLPALSPHEIEQAALLIQRAYAPGQASIEEQRRLQQELFEIQKRQEAWGLVVPFLGSDDPNVQFFGAHTAQIKIARDWDQFPPDHVLELRDLLLHLAGMSAVTGRSRVTVRKLFVSIVSLALKLVPEQPSKWNDWLLQCTASFSGRGAPRDYILDFLSIVAEEVQRSDLLAQRKMRMDQSLQDSVSLVVGTITAALTEPGASTSELNAGFKCFEAWMALLPANDLTPLIPTLISLLSSESSFIGASDTLQELMSASSLSDGSGSKTLTEPLLAWLSTHGTPILDSALSSGTTDPISHSLCKLLCGMGDHSINYIATNIASQPPQVFLRLMLRFTGLPGWFGVDEDESELTLPFWYLLQEALWSVDFITDRNESDEGQWVVVNAVYRELVGILRRKVTWPPRARLAEWSKDDVEKFQIYRRDVGDTLINAYYILRDVMLANYVEDLLQQFNSRQERDGWEEIEGALHCVVSIQEAVPVLEDTNLSRIFGPEILGRLPTTGHDRVRRTAVALIGAYTAWFTTQRPQDTHSAHQPSLLMGAISYVVTALSEPALCLTAANALRDLCDANRTVLAPHISAFGELHANLPQVPDTEKSKVLQSISSVIQALPAEESIAPVEAIVCPVVEKLTEALNSSSQLPDEARLLCINQLHALAGCAKGLTSATDLVLDVDESSPSYRDDMALLERARANPRMAGLRQSIVVTLQGVVATWSTDADVGDALSDLFKSITALPGDSTILSLPPGPLIEMVCVAVQRQLTAVWLNLTEMLVVQLDPPSLIPIKPTPSNDSQQLVMQVVPVIVQLSLTFLSQREAMESNPDIVMAFFQCMTTIVQHFLHTFYNLPPGLFDALLQCAIAALALQERYSLVSACTFLNSLFTRTMASDDLVAGQAVLINGHGRGVMHAVLAGFAGVAPRSSMQNLIELLSTLVMKCPGECKNWIPEILASPTFVQSKATPETKEKFVKAILGSRSIKRTRDAAQQFSLVARGLEGSSFGYATVSM